MLIKKLIACLLLLLAAGVCVAQSLDIDLNSTADIASGKYDIDTQYFGNGYYYRDGNVAGIYQVQVSQAGDPDLGNVAEIKQTDGLDNVAMIWQLGANNRAFITQEGGDNNIARLAQVGFGHYANLVQTGGSGNVMTVHMLGQDARIDASQVNSLSNGLAVTLNAGSDLTITQSGTNNFFGTTLDPGVVMKVTQTNGTEVIRR